MMGLKALSIRLQREIRASKPFANIRLAAHRTERKIFWIFYTPEKMEMRPVRLNPGTPVYANDRGE